MHRLFALTILSLTILFAAACQRQDPSDAGLTTAPPKAETPATPNAHAEGAPGSGTVTETMNAAGYTYVQVDTGSEKIWAAAPQFQVKVGDRVTIPEGAPMPNFHSKTLDRDFELVYFVRSIGNDSTGVPVEGQKTSTGAPQNVSAPPEVDLTNIEKAEGGITIADLFTGKDDLSGKEVTLRAKVVKFTPKILGKNWLHLQDGSGDAAAGTNDLTVTTNAIAQVGDSVLVSGVLVLDKDFGAGYKYDVIIEGAKVTVE